MIMFTQLYAALWVLWILDIRNISGVPLVVTTWPWSVNATATAWNVINNEQRPRLDAVEEGVAYCEFNFCSDSVGPRYKTDESGEITQDAMIMDGPGHTVGAVGGLRRMKNAIGVARAVMKYTKHTFIVGDKATEFAVQMGFTEENITTPGSITQHELWKANNCQPNHRQNVVPDPTQNCGPYSPANLKQHIHGQGEQIDLDMDGEIDHDTIGLIVIDQSKNVAAGVSTNGLNHKIPGRVGDSPIPGSGAYVDNAVGAAVCTGDGDIMMRFLPSHLAVEAMRQGKSPTEGARDAIRRITTFYPTFGGAILAANVNGQYGAACNGYAQFKFTVRNANMSDVTTVTAICEVIE